MDKVFYYQTKQEVLEDVMSFMGTVVNDVTDPSLVIKMLDNYISSKHRTIDNLLNELKYGESQSI